ncbi:glycosyltransferase N-terminal domain-containing protein [uncultured Lutibacter sp.]|uniref:3-deoxy-D-manno-octulosonic acid transferase n=1 Tax=uncultured Lutibacter sp. TaxID=437739 RepID=UPI002623B3DC|nr:glycosyltransferase N-terminal domain-containing protein [uncultured Lutibacter sp.]
MTFLYNIIVLIVSFILKIIALFNQKIALFINGRKETWKKIKEGISEKDKVIWMHCASLGEFEQGRPILEKLKELHPSKKIVLTFFSPSGYEVRKNYELVDVVCYLPLDSKKNVQKFLDMLNPVLVLFVKYEFWPNYLNELKKRKIKTFLISGIFRKNQLFFKWYGGYLKKALNAFTHFFVQDETSNQLLKSINFNNITVSGDTRFDRVFEITQQNNHLQFIQEFVNNSYTVVAGSTWKDDEDLLVNYINTKASKNEKFIIAPHNINSDAIKELKASIHKKVVMFSEKERQNIAEFQVFIVDTIGILTKIYSCANVAYVGGGFTKSGVHNVLEPATFGIPIVIGPNYFKFNEAKDLIKNEACFVVDNSQKLSVLLNEFFQQKTKREQAGKNALNYVKNKTGATAKILNYLQ